MNVAHTNRIITVSGLMTLLGMAQLAWSATENAPTGIAASTQAVAVVLDPASPRAMMLDSLSFQTTAFSDPLAAMNDGKYGIVVADAAPANLKAIAGAPDTLKTFCDKGGWLMLWGITPEGLSDFNKVTGIEHQLKPVGNNYCRLASGDPLLKGADWFNVVMYRPDSGGWIRSDPAPDVWSSILNPLDKSVTTEKLKPLFSINVLNKYPMGQGGVLVNQMQIIEKEITSENRMKQRMILGALLRNLGAKPLPSKTELANISDWPQWRGPDRNNISPETGLELDWAKTPPTELWRVNVGEGVSSVIAVGDKVYAAGCDWKKGEDAVWCLDAETGRVIWRYAFPSDFYGEYDKGSSSAVPGWLGMHSTPAVVEGRLYGLSLDSQAFCLDAATGKPFWHRNLESDAGFGRTGWGQCGSPLVVGNVVIFNAGAALDKVTGEVVNKPFGGTTASSPVHFMKDGRDCVIVESYPTNMTAFTLPDFKPFWKISAGEGREDDIDPVVMGDWVLFSHQDRPAVPAKIGADKPEARWNAITNGYDTPIFYKGYFYSTCGYLGRWYHCYDPKDGSIKWTTNWRAACQELSPTFHILADGKLIVQHECGIVSIYEATPDAFKPLGTYNVHSRSRVEDYCWTTPALSHGRLYCRMDMGDVIALDVRPNRPAPPSSSGAPDGCVQKLPRADQSMAGHIESDTWLGAGRENGELVRSDLYRDGTPVPVFQKPISSDWFQWRGPNRNGISEEKNLKLDWTAAQPKELWRVDAGLGYSSVVAAGDRLYTMGWYYDAKPGDRVTYNQFIFCLDIRTGRTIWKYNYAPKLHGLIIQGYRFTSFGPRSTPSLDGDRLYALDQGGTALCLNAANGNVIWKKDLSRELELNAHPAWFFSGSPLVLDKEVVFAVGTAGAALDKATGAKVWSTGPDAGGNASPVLFNQGDQQCLAIFGKDSLNILASDSGKLLWQYPWSDGKRENRCDPILVDESHILVCGGYGKGAALLEIGSSKPVWQSAELDPPMGTPVLYQGYLYGPDQAGGAFVCLDSKTGQLKWREKMGASQVTLLNGVLLIQCRSGDVQLAEANPAGFKPLGKCHVLDSDECWTPPVAYHGMLFCRSWHGELAALDLATLVPPVPAEVIHVSDALLGQLGSRFQTERESAIAQLSVVQGREAAKLMPELIAKLQNGNWFEQNSAGKVLQALGPDAKDGIPGLVAGADNAIQAGDWAAANLIFNTLKIIDSTSLAQLTPAVNAAFQAQDIPARRRALATLGSLGQAAVPFVDAVIGDMGSKDKILVQTAITTLGRMGPAAEKAIPRLITVACKREPGITENLQLAAIRALGNIGPAAQTTLTDLIETAKSAREGTRRAIQDTLNRIKTTDTPPVVQDSVEKCTEGKTIRILLGFSDEDDIHQYLKTSIITGPDHGKAEFIDNQTLAYSADYDYVGKVTITWQASDEQSDSQTAAMIIEVTADAIAPAVKSTSLTPDGTGLVVFFSKPMDKASAEQVANFKLVPDAAVTKAALDDTGTKLTLVTAKLAENTAYTLTINNLHDRCLQANLLPAAPLTFQTPASGANNPAK